MKQITGTTAVVTGAGGGMGRSIALALASEGANVVIADIELDVAERVAGEVKALGVGSLALRTDVSELEDVEALADAAYAEFGSVEILVNNAGVTLRPFRASWDTDYTDFQWMMGINFWGVVHGHHVFVPRMRQTPGEKHIVNTSSMASLISIAGHSSYSASKAAVDGLSNAAREELKTQNIGLSILHPGSVETRISSSERLRPAVEQSESRRVKPWSDYDAPSEQLRSGVNRDVAELASFATSPFERITPEDTGRLVIEGILQGKPHILTHPAPAEMLQKRLDDVLDGQPTRPSTED